MHGKTRMSVLSLKVGIQHLSQTIDLSLFLAAWRKFLNAQYLNLYNHFHDNSILTQLQSGFIPGDSTTNQLTVLYNSFCQALDSGKEVRVVFCDIRKASDRVWHKGLLCKLKAAGISGSLLSWLSSHLSNRRQRVILPGSQSEQN